MNRRPARRPSATQSAAQQAVLNKIRSGGTIQGAQPNNPLAYAAQFFDPRRFFDPKVSSIPDLKGGMVGGREALIAPGGFNQGTAGLGEITVGGQRFFPAQSGKDLVYLRAPGEVGGQYGSLRVKDQLTPFKDQLTPLTNDSNAPAERAYRQELSRTAQLTAQDPELQRYENARKIAAAQGATPESVKTAEDIGMQIWAKKYGGPGGLASKVKPGQAGYDVIQNTINPGAASQGLSAYGKAGTEYDYRDYGEPQNPTVGYQMQSPITSVPGLNATTAQQVNTGAQVQAQDLADLFKNAVFDEELMKQIQQYN